MKKIVVLIICLHVFLISFSKHTSKGEAFSYLNNMVPPPDTILHIGSPTFCQGGNLLLTVPTGTSSPFQWLLNGTPIGGATASTFSATASGIYSVITNGPDTSLPLT